MILHNKNEIIYDENNNYICCISMTSRLNELLDNEGWEKEKESWLSYRERTKIEREAEEQKTILIAQNICAAYNKYNLEHDNSN